MTATITGHDIEATTDGMNSSNNAKFLPSHPNFFSKEKESFSNFHQNYFIHQLSRIPRHVMQSTNSRFIFLLRRSNTFSEGINFPRQLLY